MKNNFLDTKFLFDSFIGYLLRWFGNLVANFVNNFSLKLLFFILINISFFYGKTKITKTKFKEHLQNEAIISVPKNDFYAIEAKSKYGSSIQIIDKMRGPIAQNGSIGSQDGHCYLYLMKGEYKVKINSIQRKNNKKTLSLSCIQYKNVTPKTQSFIERRKIFTNFLKEKQKVSYWVKIKNKKKYFVEFAGRSLGKVFIWKEGGIIKKIDQFKIVKDNLGKPLSYALVCLELPEGDYKFTFYAKKSLAWVENSSQYPFYFRFGLPLVQGSIAFEDDTSPFGINNYLVTQRMFSVKLETSQSVLSVLSAMGQNFNHFYQLENRIFNHYNNRKITKKSRLPECKINNIPFYNNGSIVSVQTLEKKFVIKFLAKEYKNFNAYQNNGNITLRPPNENGGYWVSVYDNGYYQDSLNSSSLIHESQSIKKYKGIDLSKCFHRKFNLNNTVKLILNIESSTKYTFKFKGSNDLHFNIRYYFDYNSKKYPGYSFTKKKQTFSKKVKLYKGIYILEISPIQKGIVNLEIKSSSVTSRIKNYFKKNKKEKTEDSPYQFSQFEDFYLSRNKYKNLIWMNNSQEEKSIIVRKIPLDLKKTLPIFLQPNQKINTSIEIKTTSQLNISSLENNQQDYEYKIKKGEDFFEKENLPAGRYFLTLINKSKSPKIYYLETRDKQEEAVKVSSVVRNKKIRSTTLKENKKYFYNIKSVDIKFFSFNIKKEGIYNIRSYGLLRMKAKMVNQVLEQLSYADQNGKGRNFLIQQYLKKGEYYLTVEGVGNSQGRFGIKVQKGKIKISREIKNGFTYRDYLSSGDALTYKLNINKNGRYKISTLIDNNNRYQNGILFDSDNFPIFKPSKVNYFFNFVSSKKNKKLKLLLLPDAIGGKKITTFDNADKFSPRMSFDKKPLNYSLNFNQWANEIWQFTKNEEKKSHNYFFEIKSTMPVRFELAGNIKGNLYRLNKKKSAKEDFVSSLDEGQKKYSLLQKGIYVFKILPLQNNNKVEYGVKLSTKPNAIIPNKKKSIALNTEYKFYNLDQRSLLNFNTTGWVDVKVSIKDEKNKVIFEQDDAKNDWNINFSRYFDKGIYSFYFTGITRNSSTVTLNNSMIPLSKNTQTLKQGDKQQKSTIQAEINSYLIESKLKEFYLIKSSSKKEHGIMISNENILLSSSGTDNLYFGKLKKTSEQKKTSLFVYPIEEMYLENEIYFDKMKAIFVQDKDLISGKGIKLQKGILNIKANENQSYTIKILDENGKIVNLPLYFFSDEEIGTLTALDENNEVTFYKNKKYFIGFDFSNSKTKNFTIFLEKKIIDKENSIWLNENVNVFKIKEDLVNKKQLKVFILEKFSRQNVLMGFLTKKKEDVFKINSEVKILENFSILEKSFAIASTKNTDQMAIWTSHKKKRKYKGTFFNADIKQQSLKSEQDLQIKKKHAIQVDIKKNINQKSFFDFFLDENTLVCLLKDNHIIKTFHSDKKKIINYLGHIDQLIFFNYGNKAGMVKYVMFHNKNKKSNLKRAVSIEQENSEKLNQKYFVKMNLAKDKNYAWYGMEYLFFVMENGRFVIPENKIDQNNFLSLKKSVKYLGFQQRKNTFWLKESKKNNKNFSNVIKVKNLLFKKQLQKKSYFVLNEKTDSAIKITADSGFFYSLIDAETGEMINQKITRADSFLLPKQKKIILKIKGLKKQFFYQDHLMEQEENYFVNNLKISIHSVVPYKEQRKLLSPKEVYGYSFQLKKNKDIGISYRGNGKNLLIKLYNEKGGLQQSSSIVFKNLNKGNYFFTIEHKENSDKLFSYFPVLVISPDKVLFDKESIDKFKSFLTRE